MRGLGGDATGRAKFVVKEAPGYRLERVVSKAKTKLRPGAVVKTLTNKVYSYF